MNARLTFASGESVEGELSVWFADDLQKWQWSFSYRSYARSFYGDIHSHETKEAALADFTRFGTIDETFASGVV